MEKKRHVFDIQLNAIYDDEENPTRKEVEFILHDFDVSHNYAFISKETAEKTLHTLKDMPIVCKYYEKSDSTEDDDALGSHEVEFSRDREDGEPIITMGTVPIGVFTDEAYIKTIADENGEEKEVVAGKGILWASRFPNAVGLLQEWMDEGITVVSSMEILYDSYKVEEGITEILSYIYEGHCLLNSSERGEHKKVKPAYDVSKLTKLVAQAINQEKEKEGENMKFKKVFELSHDDIRAKLYKKLDETLEGEYSWIVEVYDNYFVANVFNEDDWSGKYVKFNYSKTEDDSVEVDAESRKEVMEKREWVEQEEVKNMQAELQSKEKELEKAQNQIKDLEGEKETLQGKFESATEKVTQLNSKVEELSPYKDQVEKEQFEAKLNEATELYTSKFEAVGAVDKLENEEVKELIQKSINETEEGKDAKFKLNEMVFELVQIEKENKKDEEKHIREHSSKREKLIQTDSDFDSRYSE